MIPGPSGAHPGRSVSETVIGLGIAALNEVCEVLRSSDPGPVQLAHLRMAVMGSVNDEKALPLVCTGDKTARDPGCGPTPISDTCRRSTRRLPRLVAVVWDWHSQAACRGLGSAVFFHSEAGRDPSRLARSTRAEKVCQGCRVMEQCRRHALAVRAPYGVRGGLTVEERDAILHPPTDPA